MKNPKIMEALNVLRDEHPELVEGALDELEALIAKRTGSWRDGESMFTLIPVIINDKPIDGVIVGWTNCGTCMKHIRHCECTAGPAVPKHIAEWADQWFTRSDGFGRTAVQGQKVPTGPNENSRIDIGDLVTPELVEAVKGHAKATKLAGRYTVVRHSTHVAVVDLAAPAPRDQDAVIAEYPLDCEGEAEAEVERLNAGDS